jgi:branched-chain amino acid transport system permease protein
LWDILDIILRGTITGALFSLIAVGLNLQYGVTRILNVAHGDFLMLGAFITAFLFQYYGVNPLVSLAISGPTVFVIGVLIYTIVFRRLVRMSLSAEELEFRSLLACFCLMFIIENVVSIIIKFNLRLIYIGTNYLNQSILIMGEMLELNRIVAAGVAIIISVLLYILLRSTRAGLAMRATTEEPTGAQIVGINILNVHTVSFGLSVLLSALAGSLLGMIYADLSPLSGPTWTFIALTVIVIGGMGSFAGSLLGGFLMGYVYYVCMKTDSLLTMPVVYAFLIIMLLIRPKGLFGK